MNCNETKHIISMLRIFVFCNFLRSFYLFLISDEVLFYNLFNLSENLAKQLVICFETSYIS